MYTFTETHMYCSPPHTLTGWQLCFSNNSFVPIWGEDWLSHFVMSYFTSPGTKHHSILSVQFALRDMMAAFTLSQSVKDGTQTQEINPQWQSAIHHFHHFSCEKKEKALYSLHSDRQAHSHFLCHQCFEAGWLFWWVYGIFLLAQNCKMQTLEQ